MNSKISGLSRRDVLSRFGGAAALALAGGALWTMSRRRRRTSGSPVFTEEVLHSALGASTLARPNDVEVFAYYYPAWHPSPWMEARLGAGWTEFDTLRKARPLFRGHGMPRVPLWGEFNEADAAWVKREIETAVSYGVTGWMIDWYWHQGTMFFHEQLEQGFLKCPENSKLKFAVMWANHDWKNYFPASSPATAAMLTPQRHSVADCAAAIDYCIEHYFRAPNYWRIDGAPVFAIFDLPNILKQLGKDEARSAFAVMRERTRKAGFPDLHLQWSQSGGSLVKHLDDYGFKSAAQYHTFGWSYGGRAAGGRSSYGEACELTVAKWKETRDRSAVPFFPDCPVGWDDSPRFGANSHVVTGRSPEQYERLCRGARHFVAQQRYKAVFLSAWNEWTEDHVLLPDREFGYRYLEAVKRAYS